jgi:hypothetical protein
MPTKAEMFWGEVRRVQATIPSESTYIASIDRPMEGINGGRVFAASAKLAAQRVVEGTHRIATPEEIDRYHTEQQARSEWCKAQESKKAGKQALMIDKDLAAKLGVK